MRRSSNLAAFAAGRLLASRRREGDLVSGDGPAVRRPPDGVVVAEASIVARLLRLRLLTLDATVVIAPAARMPRPLRSGGPPSGEQTLDGAARAAPRSTPGEPIGRRLALAARTVDETAATLATTRRADAGRLSAGPPPAPRPRGGSASPR